MCTAPGFCTLRVFTTWNTSTTPSVLHRSMVVAMAQNMPQRLTVSLQERYRKTHTQSLKITHTHKHTHTHIHTQPHSHKLLHITHTYKSTPTHLHTSTHVHACIQMHTHLTCSASQWRDCRYSSGLCSPPQSHQSRSSSWSSCHQGPSW